MKRALAIVVSIALAFALTSCNPTQQSMEQKNTPNPENALKAQQFIKNAGGTYFLASAEENGQPHVRSFGTAEILDGKLYIQTGKVKNVYKQLAANPKKADDYNTIVLYFENATAPISSFTGAPVIFTF